jgi:hypothetical protein
MPRLHPGLVIAGNYRVGYLLGHGSWAEVWEVTHLETLRYCGAQAGACPDRRTDRPQDLRKVYEVLARYGTATDLPSGAV